MIELKELKNRFYVDGKPVAWDYFLDVELNEGTYQIRFMYEKVEEDGLYQVKAIIPSSPVDSRVDTVYTGVFKPYRHNMPLQMITAIGISCIQGMIKEEVQLKSCVDFCIGDALRGM